MSAGPAILAGNPLRRAAELSMQLEKVLQVKMVLDLLRGP